VNLLQRKYGEQTHSEEERTELCLESAREKSDGLAQQDFTAVLFHNAAALPRTQQTAGSESRHVRGIRQFLIGDVQFDSTRDVLPDHPGQAFQHTRQSFFSRVTSQRDMRGKIPR
jgi:hypothetical protein